jgi:hypothetical protein
VTNSSQSATARWCADCGLRLAADSPPGTWTGHVHRPVDEQTMGRAASLWAVVTESLTLPLSVDTRRRGEAARDSLAGLTGVTQSAAEMFLRRAGGGS